MGDAVHLRGLIEISNHCVRQCGYCGLRAENANLARYRMSFDEIMECAEEAVRRGYGTVVLQAGEDYGLETDLISDIICKIKRATPLAVTLSLGERPLEEVGIWRSAGADRYLLRFETSDLELYHLIHPQNRREKRHYRIEMLRALKKLGYEIGGGVMVGIPGQTVESLAQDIEVFRELDLDMIGIGPYVSHPDTPLGKGEWVRSIAPEEQASASAEMTYKMIALARCVCPEANIPATTALATIDLAGYELGLRCGANVVMPELTPPAYRSKYQIYPARRSVEDTDPSGPSSLRARLKKIGRFPGIGPGGRHHLYPQEALQ